MIQFCSVLFANRKTCVVRRTSLWQEEKRRVDKKNREVDNEPGRADAASGVGEWYSESAKCVCAGVRVAPKCEIRKFSLAVGKTLYLPPTPSSEDGEEDDFSSHRRLDAWPHDCLHSGAARVLSKETATQTTAAL